MTRTEFHVVPRNEEWVVEQAGRTRSTHDTQDAALSAARDRALLVQPSRVLLHDGHGRVQPDSPPSGQAIRQTSG